ncbi:MAG: DUF1684 domain-containing protein [Salibacteraceae bacterium]
MNRTLIILFSITLLWSCTESKEINQPSEFEQEVIEFWKNRNLEMAKESSPVPKEERLNFISLNYFKPNKNFKFNAHFELLFSQSSFKMKTNTDRAPIYTPSAKISFRYQDVDYSLIAYKNGDLKANELFLPFTDASNNEETYATGRYLDIIIPPNDSIVLDFNLSYNPYCAYNKNYSCPIPPSENHLPFDVMAGERKYH